jgi:hypothetical protein
MCSPGRISLPNKEALSEIFVTTITTTICSECGKRLVTAGLSRGTVVICAGCRTRFPLKTGDLAIAPADGLDPDDDRARIVHWLIPVERSGWAVAAGYLGLFAIVPLSVSTAVLLGIFLRDNAANAFISSYEYAGWFSYFWYAGLLALVTGLVAWRDLKRHPRSRGKVRAGFGLVIGGVACAEHFLIRGLLYLNQVGRGASQIGQAARNDPLGLSLFGAGCLLAILWFRIRRRWLLPAALLLLIAGAGRLVISAIAPLNG